MRFVIAVFVTLMAGLSFLGACSGDGGELLCDPGANIFCRCRGGEGGTKRCADDGRSFGSCSTTLGPCEEASSTSSTSGTASSSTGGSTSGKKLLEPCTKGTDCKSGSCRMGYCTKDCASWTECIDEADDVFGDCVRIENQQHCVPYCVIQDECYEYSGVSACGYTMAVDAYPVVVCADWPTGTPPLPPDGTECVDDLQCNLGLFGKERVCEFEKCFGGCHSDDDCAEGSTCSSSMPGICN